MSKIDDAHRLLQIFVLTLSIIIPLTTPRVIITAIVVQVE